MMNLTIQQGWQCPVCQRVYSPMTGLCYYCPTKTTSQSVTEAHEPWCDSLNIQLTSMPPQPAKCNCKGEQTMSIEAMKQALEALDSENPDIQLRAAISLRQAIEQAEKQCQCPACKIKPHASDCSVHNEPAWPNGPCDCGAVEQAQKQEPVTYPENFIDALRYDTALRDFEHEQAQKQEPVAWMHWLHGPVRLFLNKDEAMMELDRLNREYPVDADGRKMRPLVFGDTSPPQRQPLTDEEIEAMWQDYCKQWKTGAKIVINFIDFARAIEAAHGIKGEA